MTINGCTLGYRRVNNEKRNPKYTDVRANFNPLRNEITISCVGMERSDSSKIVQHIVRCLAHEATHAIQCQCFSDSEKRRAASLSKEAEKTGSAQAYKTYISCEVELPAHAAMIAVDMSDQSLSDEVFKQTAQSSWSYMYFSNKLIWAI
jgi:hypothetical protein